MSTKTQGVSRINVGSFKIFEVHVVSRSTTDSDGHVAYLGHEGTAGSPPFEFVVHEEVDRELSEFLAGNADLLGQLDIAERECAEGKGLSHDEHVRRRGK
jgi:hypothetical protein